MSRIAVIGGHGKIALLLSPLLTRAGHRVTAIVRNPEHEPDVAATGATPLVADVEALGTGEMTELLRGQDAVVWSAGAGGGNPSRTYAVDRDAATRSMDAAVDAGVSRYLMVSYFGAGADHGIPPDSSFFPYAEAKAAADAHLRRSSLSWTILAPSRLTDDPGTGRIELGHAGVAAAEVPRADVAAVALAVLDRPHTTGRFLPFNAGPTPIAEALDA